MTEFASLPFACTRPGWLLLRLSVILLCLGVLLAKPVGHGETVYSSKTYTGTDADLPNAPDIGGSPSFGTIIQLTPEKPESNRPAENASQPGSPKPAAIPVTPLTPVITPSAPGSAPPATAPLAKSPPGKSQNEATTKREISSDESAFFAAVQSYRKGDYIAARQAFSDYHRQNSDDARAIYYLAMTEAQLGNFKQAERNYKEVIKREADSKLGSLAREGLKALPTEATLDSPPRFPTENTNTTMRGNGATDNTMMPGAAAASPPVPAGMSAQDWMMMQMMMSGAGSGNGGNNGSWGAMAPMMMMQPSANGGAPNIDPEVMKTILMNQMMQNFDLNSSDKDRN